jgi:hypothetical protein
MDRMRAEADARARLSAGSLLAVDSLPVPTDADDAAILAAAARSITHGLNLPLSHVSVKAAVAAAGCVLVRSDALP